MLNKDHLRLEKITEDMISDGVAKMRVKPAARVLSGSMAKWIEECGKCGCKIFYH